MKLREYETTFQLVGLSRPKSVTCIYGKKQEFFWPKVEIPQDRFDALWELCKGDWSEKKLAIIQFSGYGEDGYPQDCVMVGIKY